MRRIAICLSLAVAVPLLFATQAFAADEQVTVNIDNFPRAETDMQIGRMLESAKGVNDWGHLRVPTPIDKQNVIRMNRDTLYSFALVDISKGATVTLPDVGDRYMTMMVINHDGYINKVFHGGGTHELTLEEFDTPHVVVAMRVLVDASDEADVKAGNAIQDEMKIDAASAKPFVMPNYDMESYKATFEPLLALSTGVDGTHKMQADDSQSAGDEAQDGDLEDGEPEDSADEAVHPEASHSEEPSPRDAEGRESA